MRPLLTILLAIICSIGIAQKKPKINQALSAMKDGNLSEAKTIIDEAIVYEKTKEDPKTWFYRAQIYATLDTAANEPGALEESVKAFDKTLELDPEQKSVSEVDFTTGQIVNVDSKKQAYYAYYFENAIEAYNTNNYEGAAENFETAFFIMPSDTNAILNAAYAASAAGNEERAKKDFIAAYKAGSTDMNIFLQLYNYSAKSEDFEGALEAIRMGRAVYPDDVDLMKYEINALIQLGKVEEAKLNLTKAIESDPENPDLYFNLGVLMEESKDTEGALKSYTKALEIDPDHFNSNYNLGALKYNNLSQMVKEQGNLNYYPGKRTFAKEDKENYDRLENEIKSTLNEILPIWEKLYSLNNQDGQILETLRYIYNNLKMTDKAEKITQELEALRG